MSFKQIGCDFDVNLYQYYAFRAWLLYELRINVSDTNHAIDISRKSPEHIHSRSNKELLSLRTIKHSEFLLKTEYIVLNFYSNFGTYEHNLLAYERDQRGCKFVQICTRVQRARFTNWLFGSRIFHQKSKPLAVLQVILFFYLNTYAFQIRKNIWPKSNEGVHFWHSVYGYLTPKWPKLTFFCLFSDDQTSCRI